MQSAIQKNIKELSHSFREVSQALMERTRELEALALRYEMALEASPNGLIMVNEQGVTILVNQQTESLFGYGREELIGTTVDRLFPDVFRPEHPESFAAFLKDPQVRAMGTGRNLSGRRKDGTEIPVEIGFNPIQTDEGVFVMASVVDISERIRLERQFRLAIEAAPNAMIMVNQMGKILLVNRQTETMFGYARDELIGESVDILVPDSVRPKHPELFASFFQNPEVRAMGAGRELNGRRKDGSEILVEIGLNPIETEEGILVMASVVDVSERTRMAEQFRLAIEAAPNAMIMVNATGKILLVNRQTEVMFGYERNELIGQSVDIFVPDSVRPRHPELFASFFTHPEAREMGAGRDLMGRRKDGSEIPVEIGLNPIDSDDGTLVMASVVDISARKEAEASREEQAKLEAKNEELERFAYIASHDLKAPLRGIFSIASWIEEDLADKLDEGTKENLEMMRSRISRMDKLLDDLLLYSQAGQTNTNFSRVDIKQMIEDILDLIERPEINVICHFDGEMPVFDTQRAALELVLRNLISNAIKHHDHAEIHLTFSARASAASYLFSVRDDGPGIPPKFHREIFDMFRKLESRDSVEGSGMGLALVKKTVETHGGRIEVRSEPDQRGCEFRFTWQNSHKSDDREPACLGSRKPN